MKNATIDLHTILTADFVYGNVNAAVTGTPLTANPVIRYRDGTPPDTWIGNGEIVIVKERAGTPISNGSYQTEQYLVDCFIAYGEGTGITNPEIIKAILAEIERVFNAENVSNTRVYDWSLEYDWRGSFLIGVLDFIVMVLPLTYAVST